MCGRYVLYSDKEQSDILKIIQEVERKTKISLQPGDIVPSMDAPVLTPSISGNNYKTRLIRWGYPTEKRLIVNARAESIVEKPLFRNNFLSRRCLIPCTAFYEYSQEKEPYLFSNRQSFLLLGGIYRPSIQEKVSEEFVILTKEPDRTVAQVHNRMPVIVPKEKMYVWLYDVNEAFNMLNDYSQSLLYL